MKGPHDDGFPSTALPPEPAAETLVLPEPAVPVELLPPDVPDDRTCCGDLDIRIDRNGDWYYHGSPIRRKDMVCLFASMLQRDRAGQYWLVSPFEVGRIRVDDVPFAAVELVVSGLGRGQRLGLRTNVDELVDLDDDHPLRIETDPETGEPSPYVRIHDGLEARLTRPVFYDLVDRAVVERVEGHPIWGVWSGGLFFALGPAEPAEPGGDGAQAP